MGCRSETGFQLQRSERGKPWVTVGEVGAGVIGWTDTRVEAGKEYAWRVRARNEDGFSDWRPNWPWIWILPFPTELSAAPLNARSVRVSWRDNSANERGFRLERKTGDGPFEEVTVAGANVIAFEDKGRTPATRYVYRVRAYRNDGASSFSNQSEITTPALPGAPTKLRAAAGGPDRVTLTWVDAAFDELGFSIESSGDGGATFTAAGNAPANAVTFDVFGLTPNTEYAFRVRSFNANGESGWAGPVSATTARAVGGTLEAPAKLNFGGVKVRRVKTMLLTIKNGHKTEVLHVSVGQPSRGFSIVKGGGAFDLKPGQERAVLLSFRGSRKGEARGSLQVNSSDPARENHTVQLKAKVR